MSRLRLGWLQIHITNREDGAVVGKGRKSRVGGVESRLVWNADGCEQSVSKVPVKIILDNDIQYFTIKPTMRSQDPLLPPPRKHAPNPQDLVEARYYYSHWHLPLLRTSRASSLPLPKNPAKSNQQLSPPSSGKNMLFSVGERGWEKTNDCSAEFEENLLFWSWQVQQRREKEDILEDTQSSLWV